MIMDGHMANEEDKLTCKGGLNFSEPFWCKKHQNQIKSNQIKWVRENGE